MSISLFISLALASLIVSVLAALLAKTNVVPRFCAQHPNAFLILAATAAVFLLSLPFLVHAEIGVVSVLAKWFAVTLTLSSWSFVLSAMKSS